MAIHRILKLRFYILVLLCLLFMWSVLSCFWLKMEGAQSSETTLLEYEGAIENHDISIWWLVSHHQGGLAWHLRRILPSCGFFRFGETDFV